MFGLDDWIAGFSDGSSLWLVVLVGVVLGLRHATDPDHLAAVTALIASNRERSGRAAARLGAAWGLGHATTLFLFGLPIVVFNRYLPERAQQAAETAVGILIVLLAIRLLARWRAGYFHAHVHEHNGDRHVHLHSHAMSTAHEHPHPRKTRTPFGAYGIGLVHGMGGSAGVSLLLLASIDSRRLAVVALVLLAVFTAVSMTIVTTGFGATLSSVHVRRSFNRIAPILGVTSLAFGIWYGAAVWSLAPYPF